MAKGPRIENVISLYDKPVTCASYGAVLIDTFLEALKAQ